MLAYAAATSLAVVGRPGTGVFPVAGTARPRLAVTAVGLTRGADLDLPVPAITFYAVAIPAVVVLGIGKGGFAGIGMIALPLMALVLPPLQAASIMLPILLVQDAFSAWAYRKTWDGRNLAILLPGAVLGILAAYLLATKVSDAAIELALGLISIVFGVRQVFVQYGSVELAPHRPGILLGILCGAAAGFTSMIAHAGAPPFQIYTIPQRLPRDVFVGTSVLFFTALNWIKIAPYIGLGQLTVANMIVAGTLLPLAIASTFLGVFLVRRSPGPVFFLIIYGLMIMVGLILTIEGLSHLR